MITKKILSFNHQAKVLIYVLLYSTKTYWSLIGLGMVVLAYWLIVAPDGKAAINWPNIATLFSTIITVYILLYNAYYYWLSTLDKKLTVLFVERDSKTGKLYSRFCYIQASLAGESDIRTLGQQLGLQVLGVFLTKILSSDECIALMSQRSGSEDINESTSNGEVSNEDASNTKPPIACVDEISIAPRKITFDPGNIFFSKKLSLSYKGQATCVVDHVAIFEFSHFLSLIKHSYSQNKKMNMTEQEADTLASYCLAQFDGKYLYASVPLSAHCELAPGLASNALVDIVGPKVLEDYLDAVNKNIIHSI